MAAKDKVQTTKIVFRGEEIEATRVVKIKEFKDTTTVVVESFPEVGKEFSVPSVLSKFSVDDVIFQEFNPNKKRIHWRKLDATEMVDTKDYPTNAAGFSLNSMPSLPDRKSFVIAESHWKGLVYCLESRKPIMITGYSGSGKTTVSKLGGNSLERPVEVFNMGATQEPRTTLIGVTQLNPDGTLFRPARFVTACTTPNTVILLDELTRASHDAWNILIPILDPGQRYIALDESESGDKVAVDPTVSFVATANMGIEFTSTSTLDRAVLDRFRILELPFISEEQERQLFIDRTCIDRDEAEKVAEICAISRREWKKDDGKLSTPVSTRAGLECCEMIVMGFDLQEAAEFNILPFYENEGDESERTFMHQLLQKYIKTEASPYNAVDEDDDKSDDDDVPFPNVGSS